MSGANQWLMNFHELTRMRAEHLARAEMDKGELEAAMMLLGSKTLTMFPGDIPEGSEIPDVIIRLLEELAQRRQDELDNPEEKTNVL